jgi:hypothetical protein
VVLKRTQRSKVKWNELVQMMHLGGRVSLFGARARHRQTLSSTSLKNLYQYGKESSSGTTTLERR